MTNSSFSKTSSSEWKDLALQQLVRYESLFKLLDEIQSLDDIALICNRTACNWKYFANVTNWRLIIPKNGGFLIMNGHRGEAEVSEVQELSGWDAHHWNQMLPRVIRFDDQFDQSQLPAHLQGKAIVEIDILPFIRSNRCNGLLSVAARHKPFNDLDQRFIRLFGSYLVDHISTVLSTQQAIDQLVTKATHDGLTGLLNRGAIIDKLNNLVSQAKRSQQPLSVVICDIDFFKAVNDNYGHLAGDAVLREVSRRIQSQLRDYESAGRYGGEEFLLLLYPCEEEMVAKAAERMRRVIANTPFDISGESATYINVTISLGTCTNNADKNISAESMVKLADEALYHSKENGRNRVTIHKQNPLTKY